MKVIGLLLAVASLCATPAAMAKKSAKGAAGAEAKASHYAIDTAKSSLKWEGRKIGGAHHGEVKIKGGNLEARNNTLIGGTIEIDMTSLKDLDLTDPIYNQKLVTHLKSDDFFSVEKHPVSTFKITKVEPKGSESQITGDLTIKGITQPATFSAAVKFNKTTISSQGEMTVDRTKYDIRYRSAKFFSDLGDKVIKDEFKLIFDLTASK